MLGDVISKLVETKELATVQLSDYKSNLLTGYFLKYTDFFILMQSVDPDSGDSTGFTVFEPECIAQIYWGDKSHQHINQLFQQKSSLQKCYIAAESWAEAIVELSHLQPAVRLYSNLKNPVADVGKLLIHDGDWLYLECYGDLKSLSVGKKLIKQSDVFRIDFASSDLKDLMQLHQPSLQPVSSKTL